MHQLDQNDAGLTKKHFHHGPLDVSRGRLRASWALTAFGLIVLLSGVFYFTSSTIGGRVTRFEDRRTYSNTKPKAHEAFPMAVLLGLSGLGLMMLGSRLRPRGEDAN